MQPLMKSLVNRPLILTLLGAICLTGCKGDLESLTRYTASMLCSKMLVGEQGFDKVVEEDLTIITDGAVEFATLKVDSAKGTVRSSAFFEHATAVYREGVGCTLVGSEGEQALRDQAIPDVPKQTLSATTPWPYGSAGATELAGFDYTGFATSADYHFTEHGDKQVKSSSLAIAYQGQLIYEKYEEGISSSTPIFSFSLGKTIAALFTGILVQDNLLDLHAPTGLPEWANDERSAITPHHLLTMSSGLEWNEIPDDPTSDAGSLFFQHDIASYASDKPLVAEPGTVYNYSTGNTMILSKVIKNALGGELAGPYKLLHESLLRKLMMNNAVVQADASGSLVLGGQVLMGTHDLLRLGQFLLQDGQWNGEQVVPDGWLDYMSTPIELTTPRGFDYGSGIWLNSAENGKAFFSSLPADTLIGYGWRGQFIIAVPSMELVIVRTGNSMVGEASGLFPEINRLVADIVLALSKADIDQGGLGDNYLYY